jgi:hypothetical protein
VGIDGETSAHAAFVESLRADDVFGHVVVMDAPTSVRRAIDVWKVPQAQQALWQALKHACDPHATLGAGRGPL